MKRYELIDTLRGLAVISMILFHLCWIMNHFGLVISNETVSGFWFLVWERSICIGFITISGFSFSLGRHHFRTGLIVSACGLVITLVTCLFLPEIRIVFGILTFLGVAILLMIPLDKVLSQRERKAHAMIFAAALIMFVLTYGVNKGYVGVGPLAVAVPGTLYRGYVSTFFGFIAPGFYSSDYFSLIPWFFLYVCGYELHKLVKGTRAEDALYKLKIDGVNAIGRHSLPIYIIHPIIIYFVIWIISLKAL